MLSFPTRILVLTHHGSKNSTPPVPSKRDRQGTKKSGGKFFSLPKRVKSNIFWIYVLEDGKDTYQLLFLKSFEKQQRNNNKDCLRTDKNFSKKKKKKKKKRFFLRQPFYLTVTLTIYTLTSPSLSTIQKLVQSCAQIFFLYE
jgi:hypothetical protein